jgi:hypothetical protein
LSTENNLFKQGLHKEDKEEDKKKEEEKKTFP